MALALVETRADGINPRTASKDAFALREFEAFAALRDFDPNLQTEWCKRFPERESPKLASWLLWRAQKAQPRSKHGPRVAKPMSYARLIRRFIYAALESISSAMDQLRPKRVEPVTPAIVQKAVDLPTREQRWSWVSHGPTKRQGTASPSPAG